MPAKFIVTLVLLSLASIRLNAQAPPKFMGRKLTVSGTRNDGVPISSARVCVEAPPQRQCYAAPKTFANHPDVDVVLLKKDMPALLFSAETVGTSGWLIHFALLRAGMGKDLEEAFMSEVELSNQ